MPLLSRKREIFARLEVRTSSMRRALDLVWSASARWTVLWLVLLIVQGLLPAAAVYLTKELVDGLAAAAGGGLSTEALRPVLIPGILMGFVLLLMQGLQGVVGWVRAVQSELVQDRIKTLIHQKSASIDIDLFEIPERFDSLARANGEASTRSLSLLQNSGSLLQHLVTLVGVAALLIPYGIWVPLALILSTLPALWVVVRHSRLHHEWWRQNTERQRWTTYYDNVLTLPISAAEVRLFGLADHFRAAYRDLRRSLRGGKLDLEKKRAMAQFHAAFAALLVTAGILTWMFGRALSGTASLGDVALFYQAFNHGQTLMRSMLSSVGQLYADSLFLEHLFTFLDLEPKIKNPARPSPIPLPLKEGIEFNDISFRYPGSDRYALKNLNLFIPAGKTIALVGPNGAGKTTISKLLCRFYEPTSGTIKFDGVDIRSLSVDELRSRLSVHFQSPVHYRASVTDNIAIADLDSTRSPARVIDAAKAGGVDDFVKQLPESYATLLGKEFKGGVQLSGGQWQRIALARAFYRDAPLVILDEPTSAMDSWAETKWLSRLEKLVEGRTALVITHRFSTAMRADVIFLIDEGRLLECGTHDELVALDGLYAASWKAQMQDDSRQEKAVA